MKPITEETLEKGRTRRLTKRAKYEKKELEREIKFQFQEETISIF
jgi:hypothetical protein